MNAHTIHRKIIVQFHIFTSLEDETQKSKYVGTNEASYLWFQFLVISIIFINFKIHF